MDDVQRRVEVRGSPTRCPYCHDDCQPGQDDVACRDCLARHHSACWREHRACGSCGSSQALLAAISCFFDRRYRLGARRRDARRGSLAHPRRWWHCVPSHSPGRGRAVRRVARAPQLRLAPGQALVCRHAALAPVDDRAARSQGLDLRLVGAMAPIAAGPRRGRGAARKCRRARDDGFRERNALWNVILDRRTQSHEAPK